MNLLFDLEGTLINTSLKQENWNEGLALLAESHKLYVVTSKPTQNAQEIIRNLNWSALFTGIIGRDYFPNTKSKAETVAHLIEEESLDDGESVMIGDRPHDIEAGRGNSVCAVGVLWGNGTRDELLEAGADYLCETIPELYATLDFLNRDD